MERCEILQNVCHSDEGPAVTLLIRGGRKSVMLIISPTFLHQTLTITQLQASGTEVSSPYWQSHPRRLGSE